MAEGLRAVDGCCAGAAAAAAGDGDEDEEVDDAVAVGDRGVRGKGPAAWLIALRGVEPFYAKFGFREVFRVNVGALARWDGGSVMFRDMGIRERLRPGGRGGGGGVERRHASDSLPELGILESPWADYRQTADTSRQQTPVDSRHEIGSRTGRSSSVGFADDSEDEKASIVAEVDVAELDTPEFGDSMNNDKVHDMSLVSDFLEEPNEKYNVAPPIEASILEACRTKMTGAESAQQVLQIIRDQREIRIAAAIANDPGYGDSRHEWTTDRLDNQHEWTADRLDNQHE
ncbi:hypothetical protein AAL_01282 [Moelleriella libera RCEF 2490]|uniref:Acyl-CoA N-acyltransferase n=1 Tax=Moelleriella libera RCEF 2490 TaxID=1081109 RepID=A0A166VMA4_9HYPO|nr:hypothetical protein AAL_01282 [Moelleriella libera RCEF 2490]